MTLLSTVSSQSILGPASTRGNAEKAGEGFEDLSLLGKPVERPPARPAPAWRFLSANRHDGLPYFPSPPIDGLPVEPPPKPQPDGLPYEPKPKFDSLPYNPEPQPDGLPYEPGPSADGSKPKPSPAPDGLPFIPSPEVSSLPYQPEAKPDGLPFQPPVADADKFAAEKLAFLLSASKLIDRW